MCVCLQIHCVYLQIYDKAYFFRIDEIYQAMLGKFYKPPPSEARIKKLDSSKYSTVGVLLPLMIKVRQMDPSPEP